MKRVLVQMHGEPGSGKTTLARALAPEVPAIHLDKDVVMTAMVRARLPREVAGPVSYETLWALSRSLIEAGHSVIVDSPAYWPEVERGGRGVALATSAVYLMIETRCDDHVEIERRLASREVLDTNPKNRHDWLTIPGTRDPMHNRLVLDSRRSVDDLVEDALAYIRHRRFAA